VRVRGEDGKMKGDDSIKFFFYPFLSITGKKTLQEKRKGKGERHIRERWMGKKELKRISFVYY